MYNDKIFDLLNVSHLRKANLEDSFGLALKMDKNGLFEPFGLTKIYCVDVSNAIDHF